MSTDEFCTCPPDNHVTQCPFRDPIADCEHCPWCWGLDPGGDCQRRKR